MSNADLFMRAGAVGECIAYSPEIAREVGSVTAGLLLCQLCYWSKRTSEPDGWIWKTRESLADELGMTTRELDGARKVLTENGLIEERYRRLEHRLEFRLMREQEGQVPDSPFTKSVIGEERKSSLGTNTFRDSLKGTETTTETTSENKYRREKQTKPSSIAEQQTQPSSVEPDCIPAELWRDFIAHRKAIKKPMTDRAVAMMARKLTAFAERGINVVDVVETSIRSGWSDIYEPRTERKTNGRPGYLDAVLSFEELGLQVPEIW